MLLTKRNQKTKRFFYLFACLFGESCYRTIGIDPFVYCSLHVFCWDRNFKTFFQMFQPLLLLPPFLKCSRCLDLSAKKTRGWGRTVELNCYTENDKQTLASGWLTYRQLPIVLKSKLNSKMNFSFQIKFWSKTLGWNWNF